MKFSVKTTDSTISFGDSATYKIHENGVLVVNDKHRSRVLTLSPTRWLEIEHEPKPPGVKKVARLH